MAVISIGAAEDHKRGQALTKEDLKVLQRFIAWKPSLKI